MTIVLIIAAVVSAAVSCELGTPFAILIVAVFNEVLNLVAATCCGLLPPLRP